MGRREDLSSILVVGSGPIVIGQACEFDYSGTQACRVLVEEGYRVILANSNPATIMTDPGIADRTYIEPLAHDVLAQIIERERPDALLPTMGGQTALNLAMALTESGVLEAHGVQLIGANAEAIRTAEDRDAFKRAMTEVGLASPESGFAHDLEEALEIGETIGFPIMVRPSFILGGAGTGIAKDRDELVGLAAFGLAASPIHEILVERSIAGWKEYELELMRDRVDNCVVVCSIENFDPMGVHTGDSITVAPAQTLSDVEYQEMRDDAFTCIRRVGVETGGSNIQFAVDPRSGDRLVIEMNPRVSRSSALASKATGFPIAKIAARLAVGYTLDEIQNDITGATPASFEPTIDYVVTKVPRWAFEKLPGAPDRLGTRMQSVGEVMAIGRTFAESFQKALRGLEQGRYGLNADPAEVVYASRSDDELVALASVATPARPFELAAALQRGVSVERLAEATGIDRWFLDRIAEITEARNALQARAGHEGGSALLAALTRGELRRLKRLGFADAQLGYLLGTEEEAVRERRAALGVHPTYKTVDTCGAEFAAATPYYYSTFEDESEVAPSTKETVIILGSGPNRIGQGIEFDYCCVHASMALREAGYETVMVNCNPETVSTDYDTSDRLYFEPITEEDVRGVIAAERAAGGSLAGVIVGLGGQTPLKLAAALSDLVLGTAAGAIDLAEDRERWNVLCAQLEIPQPAGGTARSLDEALAVTERIGYPALVRPSYVLGGRAMEIVYDGDDLAQAMASIAGFAEGQTAGSLGREGGLAATRPVLVDRFLEDATEVDVDAVRDRTGKVLIGGIMEHVEEAGVHSGDSACAIPPPTLSVETTAVLEQYTARIAEALSVVGPINVQYAVQQGQVFVIEANPRASRTVPFVAKATGVPLAKIAARTMLGATLAELRAEGLLPPPAAPRRVAVKEAVLPFSRFPEVDALLGPEMRSTGEVMGLAATFGLAFAKSQIAAGNRLPEEGGIFFSLADRDKPQGLVAARAFAELGFTIAATEGTASYLEANGVAVETRVAKLSEVRAPGAPSEDGLVDATALIASGRLQLVVNTPRGRGPRADGAYIRHAAGAADIPILTTAAAARAAAAGIADWKRHGLSVLSLQEHHAELRPAVGEQVGQG
ncbi:MAG TPA: carbamoyl-phosphate synthase large subunit [Acidimicrobiales bacterium]|nr:carbamoyl-phosphate synthase large subunit [Acidimicrobiales bacterium]